MTAHQHDTRDDSSAIPESESPHSHAREMFDEIARGILTTFTIERDTSLAEGAGAPGSTDVGGLARDERRDEDEPSHRE